MHGNTTSNKVDYTYNIRGWVTDVVYPYFRQMLTYNNGTTGFNGNITKMTWRTANNAEQNYSFTYDGFNRMLDAVYSEGYSMNQNVDRYTEKVTEYDKNGNIKKLQRYGQTGSSTFGLVDNLTYTYNGNKITRVDDAVTATSYTGGTNFVNGANTNNEYTYDANGNLTKDLNKGISNIQYNSLNLPSVLTFSDGSTITYTYTYDGKKLRTVHVIGSTTTTTDYCGNVIYENGTAKRLLTDEGYVDLTTNTYYYYMKDHQGNNRAVVNSSGTVQETNHYYPFGGLFATNGSVQDYKYNGKELDTKKGLNWYDYGARHYDAALGRWHVVDPMAEKYYSLGFYIYCANNPIKYIDPQGTDIYGFDINTGRLSIIKQTEDDFDRINLGVFDDNNNFSVTDSNTFLDINKGVLFGEYFDDISKSGIIFTEGFVNEGINTMKFLSFNSNIEFSAWGYKTEYGVGLSISPWSLNKTEIIDGVLRMNSHDFYLKSEKVGFLGDKYFKIHTHPGFKSGSGGLGKPSDSDVKAMRFNLQYPHYILSKKDGIVQYFQNGTMKKTYIK